MVVPLEPVDRLELVGDEFGEAADVLDQGEDCGPDGLQPAEQLAVGLARIVLPAEPQPDGTLLMLVELVRIGRRDHLEVLVRVEPEVLEPLPESSAEKVGVTIGGRTQDNKIRISACPSRLPVYGQSRRPCEGEYAIVTAASPPPIGYYTNSENCALLFHGSS